MNRHDSIRRRDIRKTFRWTQPDSSNYGYQFGDKLKSLNSTFPGETRMDYNYDGLGRRRNAWADMPNDGKLTWYRWEGWQELGSYADGTGDWDIGDIERYYIPGLGSPTSPKSGQTHTSTETSCRSPEIRQDS